MQMNDKLYNILKWVVMIALPAIATLYTALAAIWGWPMADAVSQTIAAITTFLGVLLGISTYSYNKSQAAETAAQTKTKKTSGNGKAKS